MNQTYTITPIAHIHSGFSEKFGIPRQSGLIDALKATIVFEPEFANIDALRGIEAYSHIWLIWGFSEAKQNVWSPTVRPPRLGGNHRMGVFATRSPFRPNSLGLSCVRLEKLEIDKELGPVLHVAGADLLDCTPIFDIKPYLPYVDSYPEALEGFAGDVKNYALNVNIPDVYLKKIPQQHLEAVLALLAQDPRPAYHNDPDRIYGMTYVGCNIRFFVKDSELTVCGAEPA